MNYCVLHQPYGNCTLRATPNENGMFEQSQIISILHELRETKHEVHDMKITLSPC
ncbi:hypothetical protein MtrunA17_Chr3g0118221 [Medicago truncatula]|uniref:Uncharacterized protein n=1 Tax=Medicago truncatula TaxID=3880 RepID=A0A396ITE8_MEDTR|nr:hypothetical protein MtrunA17_Chr3g0118221 [Medicago truncatula]